MPVNVISVGVPNLWKINGRKQILEIIEKGCLETQIELKLFSLQIDPKITHKTIFLSNAYNETVKRKISDRDKK